MASRPAPSDGDIIVTEQHQDAAFTYGLRTLPGPSQSIVASYEQAVEQMIAFAKRQGVRAWVETDGEFELLRNFRPRDVRLSETT